MRTALQRRRASLDGSVAPAFLRRCGSTALRPAAALDGSDGVAAERGAAAGGPGRLHRALTGGQGGRR